MKLGLKSLVECPFDTTPFSVANLSGKRQDIRVQVTAKGCLLIHPEEQFLIPIEALQGIESHRHQCVLTCAPSLSEPKHIHFLHTSLILKFQKNDLATFLKQINLLRIKTYLKTIGNISKYTFQECPHCGLFFNATSIPPGAITYCPECQCLIHENDNLSFSGRHCFAHDKKGFFSLVGTKKDCFHSFWIPEPLTRETLRERIVPVLDKIKAQLLWSLFWSALLLVTWTTPFPYTQYAVLILFFLIFGHLSVIGYYLSGLMMEGALLPLLRPPLWERLSQLIKKGELDRAEQAIKHHQLTQHPGHLINLALGFFHQSQDEKAWEYLKKAYALCPNHPIVYSIAVHYSKSVEQQEWIHRQQEIQQQNVLR